MVMPLSSPVCCLVGLVLCDHIFCIQEGLLKRRGQLEGFAARLKRDQVFELSESLLWDVALTRSVLSPSREESDRLTVSSHCMLEVP